MHLLLDWSVNPLQVEICVVFPGSKMPDTLMERFRFVTLSIYQFFGDELVSLS